MKKTFFFALVFLTAYTSFAQSVKYFPAMKANIMAIDSTFRNPNNLPKLANSFERIAVAEKNQWLPFYYAALLQVNYGFMNGDKTKADGIADKAASLINIADSLSPLNSEISTVKSMIASCRLMVDPMTRYKEYLPVSAAEIEKAISQDPNNPRPYYLKGQSLTYTPEQFGGGCKTAREPLETAIAKFAAFKLVSALHPNWGKERAQSLLEGCK